jgi:SAM-dependent methyltransferase
MKDILDAQQQHWQKTFIQKPEMFGSEPSEPARVAAESFDKEGKTRILELGGGQGRDTLFFARAGFHVHVLDYSDSAVDAIRNETRQLGLVGSVTAVCHDVRDPLPFDDESFDGCYSHMLYCMALTTAELEFLSSEVRRVLRPNGLHITQPDTPTIPTTEQESTAARICMNSVVSSLQPVYP